MAAITYKGESLIATKQANGEVMNVDRIILANIPGLDPSKPVDRNEQLPPAEHIVLDDPVSQHGYINPNLVVYALHMGTGGDSFEFNWLGLYCSEDDTVIAINYMPTQSKDPSLAMTRNLMLEFSGAQETGDIHVPAESWMVDFSQRMDGTDGRSRQMTQDVFGRQLFYGDACKVVKGSGGYYDVLPGDGYVAGIRFNFPGKSVLVSETPTSIWLDVSQQGNAMSDIQPIVEVIIADRELTDYFDSKTGVWHFLEQITIIEHGSVVDCRVCSINPTMLRVDQAQPITHLSFMSAMLDDNSNRDFIKPADRGDSFWKKVSRSEYDAFPGKPPFTKGIDFRGNTFILNITDKVDLLWCGGVPDGTPSDPSRGTDNTEAIQNWINLPFSGTLPDGWFRFTKPITLPANEFDYIIKGTGYGQSGLVPDMEDDRSDSGLIPLNRNLLMRFVMKDFSVRGRCKNAIDLDNEAQLYQSRFENMYLQSTGGSAFKCNQHFSTSWSNVHTSSSGGHGFELQGGNSTLLQNCYAHRSADGFAGYKINTAALMLACNGVDEGETWGIFGEGEDIPRITMINCNIEDFTKSGLVFGGQNSSVRLKNCTFVPPSGDLTPTYKEIIKTGYTDLSFEIDGCTVSTKGSVPENGHFITATAPANITSKGRMSPFTSLYREDQDIVYQLSGIQTQQSQVVYSVVPTDIRYLSCERNYGFNAQIAKDIVIEGSKAPVKGHSLFRVGAEEPVVIRNFEGFVDGQEITLLAKDSNVTLQHNRGGIGWIKMANENDLTLESQQVIKFVFNSNVAVQV